MVLAVEVMVVWKASATWGKACVRFAMIEGRKQSQSSLMSNAATSMMVGSAYSQVSCSHLVSRKGGERDGGEHEKLPPCWKIVWMVGIGMVELAGPHDGVAPGLGCELRRVVDGRETMPRTGRGGPGEGVSKGRHREDGEEGRGRWIECGGVMGLGL